MTDIDLRDVAKVGTDDWDFMVAQVGWDRVLRPDLVIAPDGKPYLYRWNIVRDEADARASVYMHLQVASDPERPLHDHPWDNQSVIVSGRYLEYIHIDPPNGPQVHIVRRPGDVIMRKAEDAHRLVLPAGVHYTLTIFSCGPKRRSWGFWYPDGWHDHQSHIEMRDGVSVHVNRGEP